MKTAKSMEVDSRKNDRITGVPEKGSKTKQNIEIRFKTTISENFMETKEDMNLSTEKVCHVLGKLTQ